MTTTRDIRNRAAEMVERGAVNIIHAIDQAVFEVQERLFCWAGVERPDGEGDGA